MPVRIIATYEQPVEQFGAIPGGPYTGPGVTVAAMTALDRAVADVKAQLAAADPMLVIESGPPAQDTPRT